ncbi:hypothetical protein MXB_4224, partial [Myxobolus squamalis]
NDFKDKNSSLDIEAAALTANNSNQVTNLNLIEKHTLTKFVNKCLQASINESDEIHDEDVSVEQFLDENRLTLKLKTILNYSLMNDWFSTPLSSKNTKKKYFFEKFNNNLQSVKRTLINSSFVSHCILITTDSFDSCIQKSKESLFNLEFIVLPGSEKENNDTFAIKYGSGSSCPIGLNLIHFSKHQLDEDVKKDLSQAVNLYQETCSIKIIWECYYTSKHSKDETTFFDLSNTHEKVCITNSLVGWCISDDFLNASKRKKYR